jgi:hypothetical protein
MRLHFCHEKCLVTLMLWRKVLAFLANKVYHDAMEMMMTQVHKAILQCFRLQTYNLIFP